MLHVLFSAVKGSLTCGAVKTIYKSHNCCSTTPSSQPIPSECARRFMPRSFLWRGIHPSSLTWTQLIWKGGSPNNNFPWPQTQLIKTPVLK